MGACTSLSGARHYRLRRPGCPYRHAPAGGRGTPRLDQPSRISRSSRRQQHHPRSDFHRACDSHRPQARRPGRTPDRRYMLHSSGRCGGRNPCVGLRRYSLLPAVSGLLYGVKPVVIAIILQALWKLGRTAIKGAWLAIVGLVTLFLAIVGVSPLLVLIVGGSSVSLYHLVRRACAPRSLRFSKPHRPCLVPLRRSQRRPASSPSSSSS